MPPATAIKYIAFFFLSLSDNTFECPKKPLAVLLPNIKKIIATEPPPSSSTQLQPPSP